MDEKKKERLTRLIKNLMCLDEKSLAIIESNAEILKARGRLDKEEKSRTGK